MPGIFPGFPGIDTLNILDLNLNNSTGQLRIRTTGEFLPVRARTNALCRDDLALDAASTRFKKDHFEEIYFGRSDNNRFIQMQGDFLAFIDAFRMQIDRLIGNLESSASGDQDKD